MSKSQDKTDFAINKTIDITEKLLSQIETWLKLNIINKNQAETLIHALTDAVIYAKMVPGFLHNERQEGYEDYLNNQEQEEEIYESFKINLNKIDLNKMN